MQTSVPHDADPGLDLGRLENVHQSGGKTIARCPACAESGGDASGNHLSIFPDGRFGCVNFRGEDGKDHRRRIFELVGLHDQTRPMMPPPDDAALTKKSSPAYPDAQACFDSLSAKCGRLAGRWAYQNAAGEIVFEVGRFENADGKTYRPIRHDVDGRRPSLPPGP